MQAPGADVLGAFVDFMRDLGEAAHAVGGKFQLHAFGGQQRGVLLGQRMLRFGQDALEVVCAQRRQFNADRKTPLQFRNQVRRFGQRKRAGRDEQDVIGLDDAVLGGNGGTFHQRQQVALHAFAADARAAPFAALADLVDFVDEDDAVLLAGAQGRAS